MKKENKNQIPNDKLEKIAGGGIKERLTAGMLGVSALISPTNTMATGIKDNVDSPSFTKNIVMSEKKKIYRLSNI